VVNIVEKKKYISITSLDMFNFLTKLELYNFTINKKEYLLEENNLKIDSHNINKRIKFLQNQLNKDLNNCSILKIQKINFKKCSDMEISEFKKNNIIKEKLNKKINLLIANLRVSSII
jgi:hypothetical protein